MYTRPRRNRKSAAIRLHNQETFLQAGKLIYPFFLYNGKNIKEEVPSLPGNYRWSLDLLLNEIEECMELGLNSFVLFPAVEEPLKDSVASYSFAEDNFYLQAIQKIKWTRQLIYFKKLVESLK